MEPNSFGVIRGEQPLIRASRASKVAGAFLVLFWHAKENVSGGDDFYKSYEACPTRPLSAQEATFSVKKQTSQLRRAGLFAIKNNFPLKMPRVKRRAFKWLGLR